MRLCIVNDFYNVVTTCVRVFTRNCIVENLKQDRILVGDKILSFTTLLSLLRKISWNSGVSDTWSWSVRSLCLLLFVVASILEEIVSILVTMSMTSLLLIMSVEFNTKLLLKLFNLSLCSPIPNLSSKLGVSFTSTRSHSNNSKSSQVRITKERKFILFILTSWNITSGATSSILVTSFFSSLNWFNNFPTQFFPACSLPWFSTCSHHDCLVHTEQSCPVLSYILPLCTRNTVAGAHSYIDFADNSLSLTLYFFEWTLF